MIGIKKRTDACLLALFILGVASLGLAALIPTSSAQTELSGGEFQSEPLPGGVDNRLSEAVRFHIINGVVTCEAIPDPEQVGEILLQDIWEVGGVFDLTVPDGVLTVVSDNVNDTLTGTGAQRLVLRGNTCEAKPKFQQLEIDLNGDEPVITTGTCFQGMSLVHARVIQSNDLQRLNIPTGTITITQNGVTVGQINPLTQQTHHAWRRIPYGPDGEIETWTVTVGQLNLVDLFGKTDAFIQARLCEFGPNDQAHCDSYSALQAATNPQGVIVFGERFDSGKTFAVRVACDTADPRFFVDIGMEVTVKKTGKVLFVTQLAPRN